MLNQPVVLWGFPYARTKLREECHSNVLQNVITLLCSHLLIIVTLWVQMVIRVWKLYSTCLSLFSWTREICSNPCSCRRHGMVNTPTQTMALCNEKMAQRVIHGQLFFDHENFSTFYDSIKQFLTDMASVTLLYTLYIITINNKFSCDLLFDLLFFIYC